MGKGKSLVLLIKLVLFSEFNFESKLRRCDLVEKKPKLSVEIV